MEVTEGADDSQGKSNAANTEKSPGLSGTYVSVHYDSAISLFIFLSLASPSQSRTKSQAAYTRFFSEERRFLDAESDIPQFVLTYLPLYLFVYTIVLSCIAIAHSPL